MLAEPRPLEDLIAAVARGDRDAFKSLYDASSPKLFGVVRRMVRDGALAEEVVQDAYLRIWQNAPSYSAEAGRPLSWMIAIARNRAIDVVRQRTEVTLAPDAEGRDWLDAVVDGRDREGELLTADQLRRCLGRLDETQRACVLLAYYEGYSREELASRYDKPVNTIKTWLHRSLNALKGCLDER